jgi:hypothetical protein
LVIVHGQLLLTPIPVTAGYEVTVVAQGDVPGKPTGKENPDDTNLALTDANKLDFLLAIYSAQTSYIQDTRKTVERLAVGSPGLALVLAGWFVTRDRPVDNYQKAAVIVIVLALGAVVALIVRSLAKRYEGHAQVVRRVNGVMRVYRNDEYLKGQFLYPKDWMNFGTSAWDEPVFAWAPWVVGLSSVAASVAIWIA